MKDKIDEPWCGFSFECSIHLSNKCYVFKGVRKKQGIQNRNGGKQQEEAEKKTGKEAGQKEGTEWKL